MMIDQQNLYPSYVPFGRLPMFPIVLTIHSILRWLVILFAILALYRMYSGWIGRKSWTKSDDRAGLLFTIVFDVQVLVGIILYFFLSPTTTGFLSGTITSRSPSVLFFGLEHVLTMVIALGVAHMGRSIARKAPTGEEKFRRASLFFTFAVVLILLAIPWPFSPVSRPLI
jgi:hypothetical protein